jgi:hypothetical protein
MVPRDGLAGRSGEDDRIACHRRERPAHWLTIEVGADLAAAIGATEPTEPPLIDGLTLWLSAILGDEPRRRRCRPTSRARYPAARRGGRRQRRRGGIVLMHAAAQLATRWDGPPTDRGRGRRCICSYYRPAAAAKGPAT